ncbi:ABC transporter substrate-binding protein [Kovacikia minuta CCNUW1]|uniref:ABC transporter substrate-binding protein n=1 Tax=Kovacikia minuta TaxID=2931930 RepID=UPI001CC94D62|nr:ABC transporter substrate-binding protein [Kovacikia minuta]UBF28033.1 ABC transporter substrate-binding protein [Kovacikia minuta CCNUW1]
MIVSKRFIKRVSSLVLVAASVTMFSGCASTPTATTGAGSPAASPAANTDNKPMKDVRVQLAFLMQSLDAPLIVAINKGYFAEEGLNVSYERGFGNADTISKLGTGKFDLAFSDMYNALDFNDKNPNDKIIAVAMTQNKAPFAILTFKDKGINSPKDLTGKNLGAPAGDGPRKLFPLFAKEVGVDPNSVQWTTMEPKLRETFLLQGKVDAISGFSTSALPSLLKGGKKIEDINLFYYTENGLDFYGNAILTRADYAQKNPEVVKAFIKAYMRGMQDVLKDPTAGLEAVLAADQSKLMNRQAEKVRLEVAIRDLYITPESEKIGLGAIDPKRLQTTIDQTVEGFKLKGTPKVADIYTDQFLPAKDLLQVPPASERKPLS